MAASVDGSCSVSASPTRRPSFINRIPIGEPNAAFEVVGRREHGPVAEVVQHRFDAVERGLIEPGVGLIEEQHVRVVNERASERDPLSHPV